MNYKQMFFALAVLALVPRCNCGDTHKAVDAHKDTTTDGAPPPPTVGAQIDRMGRPAINTALNHAFDVNATSKGNAKDAYNQDTAVGNWPGTYVPGANNFAFNLALLDFVDAGLSCTDGACTAMTGVGGCGNQVLYNGNVMGGGTRAANSYTTLAGVLADDQLYLDSSQGTCGLYLAVEFSAVTGTSATTCGGRSPTYDVMAFSYTALAIGLGGFKTSDGSYTPYINQAVTMVPPHADVSTTTFPFLGAPHP
jgi:hypothetical protein